MKISQQATYDALAAALTYPNEYFEANLDHWSRSLAGADRALRIPFNEWAMSMRILSDEEREELYTRTFDMDPQCTLELGWHLFGESYDRGTFLVWMRRQLRHHGLPESTDLPDHARHVLWILGRMNGQDADRFSTACVQPALETVRDAIEKKDRCYTPLIDAVCAYLESRHGEPDRSSVALPILQEGHGELMQAEEL